MPELTLRSQLAALRKEYGARATTIKNEFDKCHSDRQRLLDEAQTLRKRLEDLDQNIRSLEAEQKSLEEQLGSKELEAVLHEVGQSARTLAQVQYIWREPARDTGSLKLSLQLAMQLDAKNKEIGWILPFSADMTRSEPQASPLNKVVDAVFKAIVSLRQSEDWHIAKVSVNRWASFVTLLTHAEYRGHQSPIDSAQAWIQAALTGDPLFAQVETRVEVAAISRLAWDRGLTWSEQVSGLEPAKAEPYHSEIPLAEASQGWYRDADLVSWERPIKGPTDSLWNVQARRLRTVLMRMLAKGKVGSKTTAGEMLWQHLPEPHQSELRAGIQRLVEEQVLVEVASSPEEKPSLAINPERLGEVQSLINRDVTPFWAAIVSADRVSPETL